MSFISENNSSSVKKRGQAPGQAIVSKNTEGEEITRETEFYQLPGFQATPTPKDKLTVMELDSGYKVIVASHNYRLNVQVAPGETKIYSTDANGSMIKSLIHLKSDGSVEIDADVIIKKTLVVEDTAEFKEDVTMREKLIVENTATFKEAVTMEKTLEVLMQTTFAGLLVNGISLFKEITTFEKNIIGLIDAVIGGKSFLGHTHPYIDTPAGPSTTSAPT